MEKEQFIQRLVELRMQKGVSARDMSLSLGQSPSYINNIENGISYPSMTVFFYMCEYLGVTPQEFFDTGTACPTRLREVIKLAEGLTSDQLGVLTTLIKQFK